MRGEPDGHRGAASAAPRTSSRTEGSPLTLVSRAAAGAGLEQVAAEAARAIGRPVAIAVPALGAAIVRPPRSLSGERLRDIVDYAAVLAGGGEAAPPAWLAGASPVMINGHAAGVVAAGRGHRGPLAAEETAWLEAAGTATAVAAVIRDASVERDDHDRRALLSGLLRGARVDPAGLRAQLRRLGLDVSAEAVAVCALAPDAPNPRDAPDALSGPAHGPALAGALVAEVSPGRIVGIVPAAAAETALAALASTGASVAASAPQRDVAALARALQEAELLAELAHDVASGPLGQRETFRLLIGVLLRDAFELERLRAQTVLPLRDYDARNDTELLGTLKAFLEHDGSTTETADALNFHRHTVGYRLTRVHEVSGLSPYESEGRERLSLGLKADQLLAVWERLRASRPVS